MGFTEKWEDKELDRELLPFIRIFKDGTILRPTEAPRVPPSPSDPVTGGASKDITISEDPLIRARLHLPKLDPNHPDERFPIFVYTHGGGFCFESAFSLTEHQLQTRLVSEARILAVSVEYRLAPVHPVTTTYDDCWQALQWVAAHATPSGAIPEEPWLTKHGDFSCGGLFVGGDSAGGNIAHHLLMRAGREPLNGGMKISAGILTHPYFWGSEPIGAEPVTGREVLPPDAVWTFLCPGVEDGVDNPLLNVVCEKAPSLAGLGCERLLIGVAEEDLLLDRGIQYYNAVKESGWKGEVELVVVPGEDHAFHIVQYQKESAAVMIKRMAAFLAGGRNKRRPVDDSLIISSPPV